MDAIFLKVTFIRGQNKFRWECPKCKGRFNLMPQRTLPYRCRFCLEELQLNNQGGKNGK